MEASGEERRGDPAFAGSDAITHAPIDEEHRYDSSPESGKPRRPVAAVVTGIIVAVLVVGVIAGAAAGWAYLIPFLLIALLGAGFSLFTRWMSRRPDDVPDEVANFVVAEEDEVGGGHDQRRERSTHEDMGPSTGGAR